MLILTPVEVLVIGFRHVKGLHNITNNDWNIKNIKEFKRHYGSSPTIIAIMWADMQETDADMGEKDKSEKGFKKLLTAIHFIWAYPKNASILASTFGISVRQVQGENLWKWVKSVAKLKDHKFVWPEDEYNNPNSHIFIITVDGVDFKAWEKKHPTMPYDKGQYSHKFNHGALKYEIAIDAYRSKVVWINGPHRGGEHDKNIYRMGLKDKIPQGKKAVCDRVYGSKADPDDHLKLSMPNPCDNDELANFKARVRARHETFNGRIKFFRSLADTYHHANENHKFVFESACVMVQYQMDHGSPLFSA
jgi:hypothetical protein